MRIFLVVVLALVAIGAGGVWALGQFGDQLSPGVEIVAREPIVREPELVAANDAPPPAAAKPNTKPALSSKPAEPAAKPQAAPATPAPAPAAPPAAQTTPAPADAPAAATPAKPNPLNPRSALDGDKPAISLPQFPAPAAPPPPAQSTAPPAVSPAPAPAQSSAAADPMVKPQQVAPAAKAPATAALSQVQSAAAATGVSAPIAAQFKSRKVTYNRPPAKLALNKTVDVTLVINATADADAGKQALQGSKGEVVERDVDLSDIVLAQLTAMGGGFKITPLTVERQKLSGKMINRWQWSVEPIEIGTHTLILDIFGYESGSPDAEQLAAYQDQITVEVQQLDQVISWAKMVQPVFAVIAALAGAVSAFLAFMRFRSERKGKKAASS